MRTAFTAQANSMGKCVNCGADNPGSSPYCSSCGAEVDRKRGADDTGTPAPKELEPLIRTDYASEAVAKPDRSSLTGPAGILIIISGAMIILHGLAALVLGHIIETSFISGEGGAAYLLGIVLIILGAVTIVGGLESILRRSWGLALAGSIIAIIFGGITMILGIVALVFVSLTRNEFEE